MVRKLYLPESSIFWFCLGVPPKTNYFDEDGCLSWLSNYCFVVGSVRLGNRAFALALLTLNLTDK